MEKNKYGLFSFKAKNILENLIVLFVIQIIFDKKLLNFY